MHGRASDNTHIRYMCDFSRLEIHKIEQREKF